MITREELLKKDPKELQAFLEQSVVEFTDEIQGINDVKILLEKEQELIKHQEATEKEISESEYNLPEFVSFEGKNYSRNELAKKVVYFLNKMDVKWSYTLGLYQLVTNWKKVDLKTLPYNAYDATLRILGEIQYKGENEWRDILIVNDFLSDCHTKYTYDASCLAYQAALHNALLDRMKQLENPEEKKEEK